MMEARMTNACSKLARKGSLLSDDKQDGMNAATHSHEIFYDHWLDFWPIERSSRWRVDRGMTT
jgi:hypothetical protein